jgi:hypothetical protein
MEIGTVRENRMQMSMEVRMSKQMGIRIEMRMKIWMEMVSKKGTGIPMRKPWRKRMER